MEAQGIYLLRNWDAAITGGDTIADVWNVITTVSVHHYLLIAAFVFAVGFYGVVVRRNAISVLMSLELMLNAVNINFVAFNQIWGLKLTRAAFTSVEDVYSPVGQIFAIFIIIVAAAEAAIGLAIILAFYRQRQSVMVEDANLLRW